MVSKSRVLRLDDLNRSEKSEFVKCMEASRQRPAASIPVMMLTLILKHMVWAIHYWPVHWQYSLLASWVCIIKNQDCSCRSSQLLSFSHWLGKISCSQQIHTCLRSKFANFWRYACSWTVCIKVEQISPQQRLAKEALTNLWMPHAGIQQPQRAHIIVACREYLSNTYPILIHFCVYMRTCSPSTFWAVEPPWQNTGNDSKRIACTLQRCPAFFVLKKAADELHCRGYIVARDHCLHIIVLAICKVSKMSRHISHPW